MCLPGKDLADEALFAESQRLVWACRGRAGEHGIDWFENQLEDGLLFVVEQIALEPDDREWQHIHAVLAGARKALQATARKIA